MLCRTNPLKAVVSTAGWDVARRGFVRSHEKQPFRDEISMKHNRICCGFTKIVICLSYCPRNSGKQSQSKCCFIFNELRDYPQERLLCSLIWQWKGCLERTTEVHEVLCLSVLKCQSPKQVWILWLLKQPTIELQCLLLEKTPWTSPVIGKIDDLEWPYAPKARKISGLWIKCVVYKYKFPTKKYPVRKQQRKGIPVMHIHLNLTSILRKIDPRPFPGWSLPENLARNSALRDTVQGCNFSLLEATWVRSRSCCMSVFKYYIYIYSCM